MMAARHERLQTNCWRHSSTKNSIALVLLTLSMVAHGTEEDLCKHDEVMVASCRLDESKNRMLSFCSSNDKKTITYRFGNKSEYEFEYAFSNKTPLYRWLDKWTYTTYFGFRTAGHAYIFVVPQETYGAKAFLEVTKNNTTIMERNCAENSFGEKGLDSAAIREVEDIVVRNNNFIFPPKDGSK